MTAKTRIHDKIRSFRRTRSEKKGVKHESCYLMLSLHPREERTDMPEAIKILRGDGEHYQCGSTTGSRWQYLVFLRGALRRWSEDDQVQPPPPSLLRFGNRWIGSDLPSSDRSPYVWQHSSLSKKSHPVPRCRQSFEEHAYWSIRKLLGNTV